MLQSGKQSVVKAEAPTADGPPLPNTHGAGDWLFWLSGLGAFLWLAGAAALGSWVLSQIQAPEAPLALVLGACALAILPAVLLFVSGAAAREGARARAEARRLAEAANRMLSPSPAAEAAARRLGSSVRGEVAALDRCVEQTLQRFQALDDAVGRQMAGLSQAVDSAAAGANALTQQLEAQRVALTVLSKNLADQAASVAEAVNHHQHAIVLATEDAERRMHAADEALESRITSFAAAASLVSDRTEALTAAAEASASASLRLESVLSNALNVLAKVTGLTDAARISAEDAVGAAEQTAKALREAMREALEDARRAGIALRKDAGPVTAQFQQPSISSQLGRADDRADATEAPAQPRRQKSEEQSPGRSKWKTVLFALDDERRSKTAPAWRQTAEADTVVMSAPASQDWAAQARMLMDRAGVRIEGVLGVAALERIATASRRNASARRRAVRDAAPDTVLKLVQALERDTGVRDTAEALLGAEGRAIETALTEGRASVSAEPTRLFLVLDAAFG